MRLSPSIFLLAVGTVLSVSYLQSSLLLLSLGGARLHWAAVLLGVPLLNGLAATLLCRRAYLASFLSSVLASIVLFGLYRAIFWQTPPTLLQGAAFFLTLGLFSGFGVTAARAMRLGRRRPPRGRDIARRVLLAGYHLIAIAAAVVTLLSYLQR